MWQRIVVCTGVLALFVPLILAQSNSSLARGVTLCKNGDFDAAFEVFDRIFRESSSTKEVAAEALIQRAGCSALRGQLAARESYELVIRDYPDQPAAVNAARNSLKALPPLDALSVVYTVEIQPLTADVRGSVTRLTETTSAVEQYPTWSPDGNFVAYRRSGGSGATTIVVRSVSSTEEKTYVATSESVGPLLWLKTALGLLSFTDPASSAPAGQSTPAAGAIYSYDFRGALQPLGSLGFSVRPTDVSVSRNGDKLFAHVMSASGNLMSEAIAIFDLLKGRLSGKFLLNMDISPLSRNLPDAKRSIAVSPDGNKLAIARRSSEFDAYITVCGVDADGKDCKTVVRNAGPLQALTWTADGGSIVYARNLYGVSSGDVSRIMRIPSDGGMPTFTGLDVRGLTYFDLDPAGTRLAFDGISYTISVPTNSKASQH